MFNPFKRTTNLLVHIEHPSHAPRVTFEPVDGLTPEQQAAVTTPALARKGDAAADLSTLDQVTITPGQVVVVRTGLTVKGLVPGWALMVCSRSGLAAKGVSVLNAPGVVDSGYTGELKVILCNHGRAAVTFPRGSRVAQAMLQQVYPVGPEPEAERGQGGLGSTGTAATADAPKAKEDVVNHPKHYADHPLFSRECYRYASKLPFTQGNAFKYLWRHASKGNPVQDLDKALWYINRSTGQAKLPSRLLEELDQELESTTKDPKLATLWNWVVNDADLPGETSANEVRALAGLLCYSACYLMGTGAYDTAYKRVNRARALLLTLESRK